MSAWQSPIAFGAVLTSFAALSIAARLYTRCVVTRQIGVDDYIATASLLTTIGMFVTLTIYTSRYVPKPWTELTTPELEDFLFLFWNNELCYIVSLFLIKMTFLFQYYRVFRNVRIMRIVYIVAIVVIAVWSLVQVLAFVFGCSPVDGFWDLSKHSSCRNVTQSSWIYINAASTIITDIIVLLLPVPTIWRLKLRRSQRWAILGIFSIGGLVPAISIGRLSSLNGPYPQSLVASGYWSIAELCAGVITAALATIRLLVSHSVPALRGAIRSTAPRRRQQQQQQQQMSRLSGSRKLQTIISSTHRQLASLGSRSGGSAGSERDLVLYGDECELAQRSSTPPPPASRSFEGRRGDEKAGGQGRGAGAAAIRPGFSSEAGTVIALERVRTRERPDLEDGTDALHFGIAPGGGNPRPRRGVETKITSRGRSMEESGAEFLGTFGIVVEQAWTVQESVLTH